MEDIKEKKKIIIMLDIGGVMNNVTKDDANKFMQLIEKLRIKTDADEAIICLSTQTMDTTSLKKYLSILASKLLPNIKIGKSFYLFGTYDYFKDETTEFDFFYNQNKMLVFEENYLSNYDNINWLGIVDDTIVPEYAEKFQHILPMTIFRPSQPETNNFKDNLMCYNTVTYGFKGTIELLTRYYNDIKNKSKETIFVEQQYTQLPLSVYKIKDLCYKKQYYLLRKYLHDNYHFLTKEDFETIAIALVNNIMPNTPKEELNDINNILKLLWENISSQAQIKVKQYIKPTIY